MKRDPIASQLLATPLPVDRVARRVVMPAPRDARWEPPKPKLFGKTTHATPIATAPIPAATHPPVHDVVGRKRDRMTVMGYAADQGSGKLTRWVVRCDCGNYEFRTRIFRWLGTAAPDMCAECRDRKFRVSGGHAPSLPPALRTVLPEVASIAKGRRS